MWSSRALFPVLLAGLLISLPGVAAGQILYGQPTSGSLQMIHTSWKSTVEDQEITLGQTAIPLVTFIPLQENLEARLYVASVANSLDQLDETYELSGLTDMRLQVNSSFGNDRFLWSLGLNLPTGKTGLDFEQEWVVMNYLASDFLLFPNRRLGGGLGVNAMLGAVTPLGEAQLGGSVTYHYSGTYEAYEDNGDYNPGDYLAINAGLQRDLGRAVWLADLTYTTYSDDTQDDRTIYNRGNQLEARLRLNVLGEGSRVSCSARYFLRGSNDIYDLDGALAYQLQVYGDEFALGGDLTWLSGDGRWEYGPLADYRYITANESTLGSSSNYGIGGQIARWLSPQYRLGVTGEYFSGNADDGVVDLSGHQLAVSLRGVF